MSAALDPVAGVDPALRRRVRRGWYAYDWANSAYVTTVLAVFLGPYLTEVARTAACGRVVTAATPCPVADPRVDVLGVTLAPGSYYPALLAASILLQFAVLPLVGALADVTGRLRDVLVVSAFAGSLATGGLYFVSGDRYLLGGALYLVAQVSFGSSLVAYNGLLPHIAEPAERDRVSSRGWAAGYLGGGLLLLANLAFFSLRERLGVDTGSAVRISLASAGLWWALFTLVPLRRLPHRVSRVGPGEKGAATGGRVKAQLRGTLRSLGRHPRALLFLAAYLVYNDGIQSVITLASVYGVEELGVGQQTILVAILIVQFVAFAGALALGAVARRFGARNVVLASLLVWALILAAAYFLPREAPGPFFALAAAIGVVLGGSQALSRALFSQLVPAGREAEYFSVYELGERGTSWLGAVIFAAVYEITGSYRASLLSLIGFFLVGFGLLVRLDVSAGIRDARSHEADGVLR